MNLKTEETREAKLVAEVERDFAARREARRNVEAKWLLNVNFMVGNQYSEIAANGDIADYGKRYFWQEREVYNHIAPLIESRLAKFARVNCAVNVRPASGEDKDVNVAKLATKIVESTQYDNGFVKLFSSANYWAELTGTAFYKILWNAKSGLTVGVSEGKPLKEGNVKIVVCPPYEVYPDSMSAADINACRSLIHARAYPVEVIEDAWGVKVEGGEVSVISMDTAEGVGGFGYSGKSYRVFSDIKKEHAVVIERYDAPSGEFPRGRLLIVAGGKLLYEGDLPYLNAVDGKRGFPFVRQVALEQPASFYGMSVIERLIPIQRAYNAVKNRKHEFLNRLSVGVLAVEDGSVDTESLEEEGLCPGKVITYRQGSTPPRLMSPGTVPQEFREEEDRLLSEFQVISGVSSLMNISGATLSAISGYALSLLLEQDYSRLSVTTESIRSAVKEVCRQILRLYRQFAKSARMVQISGENGALEVAAFTGSELNSDDIIMESDSEMVETPATRKNMVFELLKLGLLGDENGKISNRNRAKILEMLGFGNWEAARSSDDIHLKKCALENADMQRGKECKTEAVDDHAIHVEEHSRYLVAGRDNLTEEAKELLNAHIRRHKVLERLAVEAQSLGALVSPVEENRHE